MKKKKWGSKTLGRVLTGSKKWQFYIEGTNFQLKVGEDGESLTAYHSPSFPLEELDAQGWFVPITYPLAMLHELRVVTGVIWAKCVFRLYAEQTIEITLDGIKNADAQEMQTFVEQSTTKLISKTLKESQNPILKWREKQKEFVTAQKGYLEKDWVKKRFNRTFPRGLNKSLILAAWDHPKFSGVFAEFTYPKELADSPLVYLDDLVCDHNQVWFELDKIRWVKKIKSLFPPDRWITHSNLLSALKVSPPPDAYGVMWFDWLLTEESNPEELGSTQVNNADDFVRLLIERWNNKFLKDEATRWQQFFRKVEKNPLTDEQVKAVVCFDDRVLTIAAAGSGKTSAMVAKAGYAVKREIVQPNQILMLAFNTDAQEELQQRIEERLTHSIGESQEVKASTFHALGLSILGEATGKKPSVASFLNGSKDIEEITSIIDHLRETDIEFRSLWVLYRLAFSENLKKFGEKETIEDYDYESKKSGFRTLNNEIVKSKEERVLANWLFANGIKYEYERSYEHETADHAYSQYHPDFYYPDIDVYHEHFALDENEEPPEHFHNYKEGVIWKRGLHKENETTLIETTSATLRSGQAFVDLIHEFEKRGLKLNPQSDPEQTPVKIYTVAKTFRTFMGHVKGNQLLKNALEDRFKSVSKDHFKHRFTVFLNLYFKIAEEWERRLKQEGAIDFEDMLNLATDEINAGNWHSPYHLVMVDEFQDTSLARGNLVKALIKETNTFLYAVGDDWQSINKFAGADLTAMTGFEDWFGKHTETVLSKSFRCTNALCDLSSKFIQKNPLQISKDVEGISNANEVALYCESLEKEDQISERLESALQRLFTGVKTGSIPANKNSKVSVFILGRYRHDRPESLGRLKRRFEQHIELDYSTIHGAKGLEADYVILPSMYSGRYGFPSQIEDDQIFLLVNPQIEEFELAEERRVFYVAMTRARRMVIAFTLDAKPSSFLAELAIDGDIEIKSSQSKMEICPQCKRAALVKKDGKNGEFLSCSSFPVCDFTKSVISDCPQCNRGQMTVRNGEYGKFLSCSRFPHCNYKKQIH